MKLKLDENLHPGFAALLASDGHEVASVRDERLGGAPDEEVFRAARAESRTLVTLDLDFTNPLRFPPAGTEGIVVVRTSRPLLRLIEDAIRAAMPRLRGGSVRGRLWIVEQGRIREYAPGED